MHFWLFSDSVYDKIILLCKIGPKGISLSFKVICYLLMKVNIQEDAYMFFFGFSFLFSFSKITNYRLNALYLWLETKYE